VAVVMRWPKGMSNETVESANFDTKEWIGLEMCQSLQKSEIIST